MTLKQFMVFAAISRCKSVTRAARELATSQPTVSKHLKSLERRFGAALFFRTGNGLEFTELGERFYNDVIPILTQLESIDHEYTRHSQGKSRQDRRLRVMSTYGPGSEIVPRLLGMYKRIHPDADITLGANQTHVIERLIEKHQVEIAVVSRMAASKTLASEPFVSMRITAFVANNNPFTKKSVIDLSELEKFPLITRGQTQGRGNTELILAEMRKQGYRPNILMRYESPDALKTAVQNKLGIGFLFEDAIKHAIARGGFKRLRIRDLEMVGHTYIIYNKEHPLSFHAEGFLTLLRQWRDRKKSEIPKQ